MTHRWISCTILILSFAIFAETKEKKNVQLLTGLSDREFQRSMNFIRASLGVHCDFCHVVTEKDGWQWDKDDKQTKQTARKMIRMVAEINKTNFDAKTMVTCFTCHQGRIRPDGIPPLPQVAPTFPTKVDQINPEPEKALAIIKRYFDAIGGEPAIQAASQLNILKGNKKVWKSELMPLEIFHQPMDKWLMLVTDKDGTLRRGSNGKIAWTTQDEQPREMKDAEYDYFQELLEAVTLIPVKNSYASIAMQGETKIGDRQVSIVEASLAEGIKEKLFFDAQNGYLLRRIRYNPSKLGVIPEQFDYDNYKQIDGISFPHTIQSSYVDPWMGTFTELTEIKWNVPVDQTIFEMPFTTK